MQKFSRLIFAFATLIPVVTWAQQDSRVWQIGFLGTSSPSGYTREIEALRLGLRETGYIEGKNLKIDFRWAENKMERLPALAEDLANLKVDLIIASLTPSVQAAKNATSRIPIVMAPSGDPVGAGLVASLARPGGNVTGMSNLGAELAAKNLEILRELVPRPRQVAVLTNATDPFTKSYRQQVEGAGKQLGIPLRIFSIGSERDLGPAFSAMAQARVSAVMVQGSVPRNQSVALAQKHRIPSVSATPGFADAGAMLTYSSSVPDQFRRVASYVDRIFKGANPAEMPVEQPTKFELVINAKAARAIGVAIPQALLLRADRVIE